MIVATIPAAEPFTKPGMPASAAPLQRLAPRAIDGAEADHALSLLVIKQIVVMLPAPIYKTSLSDPGGGREEVVESIGEIGPPRCREVGHSRGHGQVLAITASMAAYKGQDDEG